MHSTEAKKVPTFLQVVFFILIVIGLVAVVYVAVGGVMDAIASYTSTHDRLDALTDETEYLADQNQTLQSQIEALTPKKKGTVIQASGGGTGMVADYGNHGNGGGSLGPAAVCIAVKSGQIVPCE